MPNTENMDSILQDQIDAYVRGKMLPDEEIQFEAKYLGNVEVVNQIECLYALKQGLAQVEVHKPNLSLRIRAIINYLAVPQMACGALAATLLWVPFGFLFHANDSVMPISTTELHLISDNNTRGLTEQTEANVLQLNNQKELLIGFVVPIPNGKPKSWTIEILNSSKKVIWRRQNVYPDYESRIYLRMTKEFLSSDKYSYRLSLDGEQSSSIEGKLDVIP